MRRSRVSREVRQTIGSLISGLRQDPVFNLLSRNSSLAKAQLETLLVDALSTEEAYNLTSDQKASLRRRKVSKGAFNRSLSQAHKNVRESLFTTLLMGYLGLLESPSLASFLELGERLSELSTSYRQGNASSRFINENRRVIIQMIEEITQPKRMSKALEAGELHDV